MTRTKKTRETNSVQTQLSNNVAAFVNLLEVRKKRERVTCVVASSVISPQFPESCLIYLCERGWMLRTISLPFLPD